MKYIILLFSITLFCSISLFAQKGIQEKPDSLKVLTVSGTVTVDSTFNQIKYFLEVDGDSILDYMLNFGPHWYTPDSSNATRPLSGDVISVYGSVNCDSCKRVGDLQVIIVYQIDGQYWRDPFEPFWLSFLGKRKGHSYGYGNHHGYTTGWMEDSLTYVEVSGTIKVDTTFNYWHYYLDSDGDTTPNYYLNFGPPWYLPESGLEKPENQESVSVYGAVKSGDTYPVIVILRLNGEVWRDTTGLDGRNFGGKWIHKNMNQNRFIHTPFDTACIMEIRTDWRANEGSGLDDSMYCQMLQVLPENISHSRNENAFAAFETGIFNHNRINMMFCNDSVGGKLQLASQIRFQFHYNDIQAIGNNVNESTIQLKTWNADNNSWEIVPDVTVDEENNLVFYESNIVNGLTLLTANESITSISNDAHSVLTNFRLEQNYPNPFNPTTNIKFSLNENARIVLTVYNVLGQKVQELLNAHLEAGEHKVVFKAGNLSSGRYFCELKSGGSYKVIKMTLIK